MSKRGEYVWGVAARWAKTPTWMEEAMCRYAAKQWLARERFRLIDCLRARMKQ